MPSDPNDRLMAAIGMMGSESAGGEGEAMNAFRLASRLLKARGLTWADVATLAFGEGAQKPNGGPTPTPPPPSGGTSFTDIFDGMFSDFARGYQRRDASRQEAPKANAAKTRVHGVDVPREIAGTVRIVDADRAWRDGPMLVLEIVGENFVYGPLICFAASVQADLRHAHDRGKAVIAKVRPPRSEGQMPVVASAAAF